MYNRYINKKLQKSFNESDAIKYKNLKRERNLFLGKNMVTILQYRELCQQRNWRAKWDHRQNNKSFYRQMDSFNSQVKKLELKALENFEKVLLKEGNVICYTGWNKKVYRFIVLEKESRDHYNIMEIGTGRVATRKWIELCRYYELDGISKGEN